MVRPSKLYVSPLWIQPQKTDDRARQQLRKKYGFKETDHVLVCYGFMTSYKGVDWLIEAVDYLRQTHPHKNIKLVLAGGKAPSQTGKAHYERYYSLLEQRVAKTTHMVLTGFIPEKQVKNYFSLADLVILPYRGILGASASWGQSMAHGKPFLISKELQPYLESSDIAELMELHGLKQSDIVFKRHRQVFAQVVLAALEKKKSAALTQLSKDVSQARSPEKRIAIEFEQLYTPQARGFSLQWNRAPEIA
jgi:glycosyltransferase involved in cell wall biosynthesis